MYKLFYNGYVLHDPIREILVRESDIDLAVGEPGHISFVIDPDHSFAGSLQMLNGTLRLEEDGNAIWRGRLIRDTTDFTGCREIEAEGLLACLNDSVVPPFDFPTDWENDPEYIAAAESGNVVEFFLRWLVENHNAQVGEARRISLGAVTVTDPNNFITRASSGYNTTLNILNDKVVKPMGGYLLPDYTNEVMKLEYFEELPLTNTQSVEYAGNLLDLLSDLDAGDTYTAIWPTGKDGLDISELPDGPLGDDLVKLRQIIFSKKAEAAVGSRVTRHVEWKDVTIASNLQQKAAYQLARDGVMHTRTITVKAADLGGLDGTRPFRVGRMIRICSAPHHLETILPLMELKIKLEDPAGTVITMGSKTRTASDINQEHQRDTDGKLDEQKLELDKKEQEILDVTTSRITEAVQTSERIILKALEQYVEVGEYEEFRKTVSTQMQILSDGLKLEISKTSERIENVNGDMQSKYESITKLIRASIDGILIGESGSDAQLRLDNDIIQMLVSNVAEVIIDHSGLFAEQATVKTIHQGPFTWSLSGPNENILTLS